MFTTNTIGDYGALGQSGNLIGRWTQGFQNAREVVPENATWCTYFCKLPVVYLFAKFARHLGAAQFHPSNTPSAVTCNNVLVSLICYAKKN